MLKFENADLRSLAALAGLACSDNARWALGAIKVRETEEGYELVVTDGKRLAVVSGDGLVPAEDAPADLAEANGSQEALIDALDWGKILKGAKKEDVWLALGERACTFLVGKPGGPVSKLTNVEGRFPPVDAVVEGQCSLFKLRVDPKLLAGLLTVAGTFSDEVHLHFGGRGRCLLVTADNGRGLSFEGGYLPAS